MKRYTALVLAVLMGLPGILAAQTNTRVLLQHNNGTTGLWELDPQRSPSDWSIICNSQQGSGWMIRDIDVDRVLLQRGTGGMIGVWAIDEEGEPVTWTKVSDPMPGWIARSFDDNRILLQKGDGGTAGIWKLDGALKPTSWHKVCNPTPGWILRSLDDDRILLQRGRGGMCGIWNLNTDSQVTGWTGIGTPPANWATHSLSDNMVLLEANTGLSGVWNLDTNDALVSWTKISNPLAGWSVRALDANVDVPKRQAGSFWTIPATQTVSLSNDFTIALHLSTGIDDLGTFQADLVYDPAIIDVDITKGYGGVSDGSTHMYTLAANSISSNTFRIIGSAMAPHPSGPDKQVAIVHWKAVGTGASAFSVTNHMAVNSVTFAIDPGASATGGTVTVE